MITVHARTGHILRRKRSDDGIVPFFCRGVQKTEYILYIFQIPDTRQHGKHSGLIQGILDTLVCRQRLPERRRLRAEELSAGIRFHNRDPDSLGLAAAVKLHTLTGAASCAASAGVWEDRPICLTTPVFFISCR